MTSKPLTRPSIDADLAERLKHDKEFRGRYLRRFAQSSVAAEIRGLRKHRRLRQAEVAVLARTGQSAISRIEGATYDGWTFKTLLTIAFALDARLSIALEPIENVIKELDEADEEPQDSVEPVPGTSELSNFDREVPRVPVWLLDDDGTSDQTAVDNSEPGN